MPSALKLGAAASFLLLLTCCWMLSAMGLWPSWFVSAAKIAPPISILLPPPTDEPANRPPSPTGSSNMRAVEIPPVQTALAAVAVAGLPSVVTPVSSGGVVIKTFSPPVQIPRMPNGPLPGTLALPAGTGPFPAVILLHGCNGPFPSPPGWAYRLNSWGYAVLMPDSMTPRGVKTVCDPADQPKVTPWDRVGDIGAAAAWLRTRPEIDPARIAVLGLSHGGATAAIAVQTTYSGIRLRAAIDYYGPCIEPQLHGAVPLLVLAGEADDWGDPASRCRTYQKALRPGQPFEMYSYPGVFHGFDSGPATKTIINGHALAFDKAAAEDSFLRVRTFLDRRVKF